MLVNQSQSMQSSAESGYMRCSHDVICKLIDIASAALLVHFPKAVGDTADVEVLLDALRVLRPQVVEMGMLEGVLHLVHARWDEAMYTLHEVVARAPNFDYAKAMLAYCMASKGVSDWRQWAAGVLEGDATRETRALIRALEAREDLLFAKLDYRGGEFVVPESCRALAQESSSAIEEGADGPSPKQSDEAPLLPLGYIRA